MKKCISNGMDDYLASIGLWRKPTAKDGSSLFRAVAEQVFHTQALHPKVREDCINFMLIHKDLIFPPRISESLDHRIEKLRNPREWGGQCEILALSFLYKRDFILYKEVGAPPKKVTNHNFKKTISLCFSNGNHYDSIYPRSYIESAKICQSIVYEILYKNVFKMTDAVEEAKKMIQRDPGEIISGIDSLMLSSATETECSNYIIMDKVKDFSSKKDPFPFKVAKALCPDKYRNVELDLWKESRKENPYQRDFYPVREFFFPGDKCQVRKNGHTYNAHIQDMSPDRGPVTVFLEELGEKDTVPYNSLIYIPRDQRSDGKEKKLVKKKDINYRSNQTPAPMRVADGLRSPQSGRGKPIIGLRGNTGPRVQINAAGHPVKRPWNYQENFRGRFPPPVTHYNSYNRDPNLPESNQQESQCVVTSVTECVEPALMESTQLQISTPMNLETPPLTPGNPDMAVPPSQMFVTNTMADEMTPPPLQQTTCVSFYQTVPPFYMLPQTCQDESDMIYYSPGLQTLQTYPMNMSQVSYPVEEDTAHTNNGQCNIAKDGKILVKTNDMARTTGVVQNGLVDKLNKLNLNDNTVKQSECPKDISNDNCQKYETDAESYEANRVNSKNSVSSQDSGVEFDLSSSEGGADADGSVILGDESVDSLDCQSDSSSQHSSTHSSSPPSTASSSSPTQVYSCNPQHKPSKIINLPVAHYKAYEVKMPQASVQQMRPIPHRFRCLLDEEARKNPSQHPKRFEGQPLVRHKPLGNRKRKLARLAHIALMMEMGSEKSRGFEFNPEAECFQPRHFVEYPDDVDQQQQRQQEKNSGVNNEIVNGNSRAHLVKTNANESIDQVVKSENSSITNIHSISHMEEKVQNNGDILVKTDNIVNQQIGKGIISSSSKTIQNVNNNVAVYVNIAGPVNSSPSESQISNGSPVGLVPNTPVPNNNANAIATSSQNMPQINNNAVYYVKRPASYTNYYIAEPNRNVAPTCYYIPSTTPGSVDYQNAVNNTNNEINNNITNSPGAVVYTTADCPNVNNNSSSALAVDNNPMISNVYSPTGCMAPSPPQGVVYMPLSTAQQPVQQQMLIPPQAPTTLSAPPPQQQAQNQHLSPAIGGGPPPPPTAVAPGIVYYSPAGYMTGPPPQQHPQAFVAPQYSTAGPLLPQAPPPHCDQPQYTTVVATGEQAHYY